MVSLAIIYTDGTGEDGEVAFIQKSFKSPPFAYTSKTHIVGVVSHWAYIPCFVDEQHVLIHSIMFPFYSLYISL